MLIFMLKSTSAIIYYYLQEGMLNIYCNDSIKDWKSDEYQVIQFLDYYPKTRYLSLEGNYTINRNMFDNLLVKELGNVYQ